MGQVKDTVQENAGAAFWNALAARTYNYARAGIVAADDDPLCGGLEDEVALEDSPTFVYIYNVATGYLHMSVDAGESLKCGKPLPLSYSELHVAPEGANLCSRCF